MAISDYYTIIYVTFYNNKTIKIAESYSHYFTFYDYYCNSFVLFNNFEFKHHSAFISIELFFCYSPYFLFISLKY